MPYEQVKAYSEKFDTMSVASLEHLLVLKLEALIDRMKSSKGSKDIKDLLRISQIAAARNRKLRKDLIEGYLSEKHLKILREIEREPEFMSLAKGNAKTAKSLRGVFTKEIGFLFDEK